MTQVGFLNDDQVPDFRAAIAIGFGADLSIIEGDEERFRAMFPLETCIAATDEGRVIATFGSFDFDLSVPGGTVPMAGTTVVTVHPTHRRQGLLTKMMTMHLRQAVDRGQPLAGLWASETTIYGRFGYGNACKSVDITIPTNRVSFPEGSGQLRLRTVSDKEAATILPKVYDAAAASTPGLLSRSEAWWTNRKLFDPEQDREGATSNRHVVAFDDTEPVGYVTYRQKEKWGDDMVSDGVVTVSEIMTLTNDARRTLWHFLSHIDLFPTVKWWNAPVDSPISIEVDQGRELKRILYDTLWIRILDVQAALQGRAYEADGSIVLDIDDPFLNHGGKWQLIIQGGKAKCMPTDQAADVKLDISTLGRLYLGGVSAVQLTKAGLIDGSDDAVRSLHSLFATAVAPYCCEIF